MKNIYTFLFLMSSLTAFGQTKIYVPGGASSGIINNTNNSNIGIGISSPSATLHVNGNLKTTARINGSEYISVDKNGSYRVAMNGQGDGYIVGRNDFGDLKFRISANGSSYFNGGNIGIGIVDPSATLHVIGNLKTSAQINGNEYISVDKNGSYRVAMNGQTDGYIVGKNDNGDLNFRISSNGNSYFNGGNIGIGTSDPSATLHMIGDEGLKVSAKTMGSFPLTMRMVDGIEEGGTYRDDALFESDGAFLFKLDRSGNGISQLPGFVIFDKNNESLFMVNELDGNVSIGTTESKGYKLAVAGKVIAEEIVVKLRPWPDYVFEEDYPLIPLQDLSAYLKENKHLPGVPTAREVEEEGVKLGEMNAKLLEKVEELTLYIIAQDAVIWKQSEHVENLETRTKKLEQLINNFLNETNN